MSYLLKILPSTLKTQLAKFLYQNAILVNKFLQDRDDNFYSKYLEEMQNQKFVKGDVIAKIGNKPEWVYLIMNGVVHNTTTGRYFEAGQMINHDCIVKKQLIFEDLVADTADVSVIKYERETFLQILDQFPDIQEDMNQMIKDKEDQMENEKFIKHAVNNDSTRNIIVNYYKDIINEEKDKYNKISKSLALRLNLNLVN